MAVPGRVTVWSVAGTILIVFSVGFLIFASAFPYWSEEAPGRDLGFPSNGLWEICFRDDGQTAPAHANDELLKSYYGCNYVFDRKLREILHWYFTDWFISVVLFVTLGLVLQPLALIMNSLYYMQVCNPHLEYLFMGFSALTSWLTDLDVDIDDSDADPTYCAGGRKKGLKGGRSRTRSRISADRSSSDSDETSTESESDPDVPGPSTGKRSKKHSRSRPKKKTRTVQTASSVGDGGDADTPPRAPARAPNPDEWSEDLTGFPNIPDFTPDGPPGVNIDDDSCSPMGVFAQIITGDLIRDVFVRQTNIYASEILANMVAANTLKDHSRIQEWKPVTEEEMVKFLLILLHMSLVKKHKIEDYWSTKEVVATSFAGSVMSRNRFQLILNLFHLNDNADYVPPGNNNHDPLFKVRPFYNHLREIYPRLMSPNRELSIDEAMCGWRGPLRFSVYIKDKPVSRGIKLYMITDSATAYVLNFEVYAGDPAISNKPDEVVMRLMQPYLHQGFAVYTDNYYTSPMLVQRLVDDQTAMVGTVRSNRKQMPKDLAQKVLKKGEIAYRRRGDIVAIKWKDKRDVFLLTTKHNPTETTTTTTRHATTVKPSAVVDYTKNMCGCDRSDQFHAYVPLRRRSLKWWKKLFMHLFVLSLVQAHILHNQMLKKQRKKTWKLHKFLITLATDLKNKLVGEPEDTPTIPAPGPSAAAQSLDRLQGKHFPEPIPPTQAKKHPARTCKVCKDRSLMDPNRDKNSRKRVETKWWCPTCNTALCLDKSCFRDFHTKKNYHV